MYNVCIVTGTRAEYGILKPLIKRFIETEGVDLRLVVTGAHLSTEYGYTVEEIRRDGFNINAEINIGINKERSITDIMADTLKEFGIYFSENKTDILIVLGDRYEIFAVATAAMMNRVPIAHIHGGEITRGAIDDAIRHCITKMSYIHFPATEEYRKRIIQLGEEPERVYNVGSLAVESIKKLDLIDKDELEKSLGVSFDQNRKLAVLTYHPETLGGSAEKDAKEIIDFMDSHEDIQFVITGANADAEGVIINRLLEEYANSHGDRCSFFMSLGQKRYFSLLKVCDLVIGNSSSGIIEVPSFGVPTVNIGDRQLGRARADSVIDCRCEKMDIERAYSRALSMKNSEMSFANPYEGKNTCERIVDTVIDVLNKGIDLKKKFYDTTC